jgi:hypothetical protein
MPLSRSPDALVAFLLPNLPAMLVWLVGIAVALSTWRRHPRVSQTALVACVLLLVNAAGGPVAQFWVFQGMSQLGWTGQEYGRIMALVTLVRVAFSTVGYVLLLLAVFGWRATRRFPVGPPAGPFAERTAVRPAHPPGAETAIRADEPRP